MSSIPQPKLQLTDDEWRKRLNAEEYQVLRKAGTERAFTGEYTDTKTEGVYQCRACGTNVNQPRAWLRSLTPPRTMERPGWSLSSRS